MQTRDLPPELLVPPKRLGNLLAGARNTQGLSLAEAADRLGRGWTPVELLEVETGLRPVLDPDIERLTELYGIPTSDLIPERSHLVIDLNEGTMEVGARTVSFTGSEVERREVLGSYLAMVYSMRDLPPGTALALRSPDLEILEGVLSVPQRLIEEELRSMMVDPRELVTPRLSRLKGRVLVPVIGVVVAATAAGLLLLVSDSDASTAPGPVTEPTTQVGSGTTVTPDGATVEVELGDAVVQERLPDGSPGPVTVRD